MPVPCIIPASLRLRKAPGRLLLAITLVFVTNFGFAKGPEPAQSIALEPLGFQTPLTQFMLGGNTMLTVDFVDSKHLLLTYSAKRLLKRLPECPPSDQDRVVDAVLLELPGGKVLERTSWRTHDHGQYLWNLGQGRFMLRIRNSLSTFAPMVNFGRGDAFLQNPFIRTDRRIGGIMLSPDADLMILETMDPPSTQLGLETKRDEQPVQINFFRLTSTNTGGVDAKPGAALRSRVAGRIPANAAGFLTILDQGREKWSFDFRSYGGKVKELGGFDSTCRPAPMLVSRSEFIAFGCHLSHTPQVIGAFNLRGEEMWEQNMTETYVAPTFSYASESGRFALSRVLTRASLVDDSPLSPDLFDAQSIVVYQTDSGQQLLRVDAAPIARAGQNFALSPDGLSLAVIRNEAIQIFKLPPLTPKDREAVQMAKASAPQIDGALSLALAAEDESDSSSSSTEPASPAAADPAPVQPANGADANGAAAAEGSATPAAATAAKADSVISGEAPAADQNRQRSVDRQESRAGADASPAGDNSPEQRRSPPTLYAPGEKHENGASGQEPPK